MFLSIFNRLVANSPGFMRPAVNWLVNGLRNITNYIGERWNAVGHAVGRWLVQVAYWGLSLTRVLGRLAVFASWLVLVRIPSAISTAISVVASALSRAIQAAREFAAGLVAGLRSWAVDAVNWLVGKLSELASFVSRWIDHLRATLATLIGALKHVLQGPDVLAQWLVGAMWRASGRFLAAQRDRIALFLTRESVAFTRWLARELEDIILRWL